MRTAAVETGLVDGYSSGLVIVVACIKGQQFRIAGCCHAPDRYANSNRTL
jgi:hypothetical protein